MVNYKRIFAFAAAAMVTLPLAACGDPPPYDTIKPIGEDAIVVKDRDTGDGKKGPTGVRAEQVMDFDDGFKHGMPSSGLYYVTIPWEGKRLPCIFMKASGNYGQSCDFKNLLDLVPGQLPLQYKKIYEGSFTNGLRYGFWKVSLPAKSLEWNKDTTCMITKDYRNDQRIVTLSCDFSGQVPGNTSTTPKAQKDQKLIPIIPPGFVGPN